jgi:DNA invertase Pin-like site-specific DNA recombinase
MNKVFQVTEGRFVCYFRVSTARQGRSGLGLEAQKETVALFLNGSRWDVMTEFVEIETGTLGDDERPQLGKAIQACRIYNAKLLVSKLDRLSRDAHWLLGLAKRGIDFICADNPAVNRMTITVLAAVAEHERKQISERTKQALAARKARGLPLGMAAIHAYREAHQLPPAAATNLKNRAAGTARSAVVNRVKAQDQARDLAGILAELRAGGATSLRQIATGLNDRRIPTTRGGAWSATQVSRLLARC